MKTRYITIDTSTTKGLKKAERLKAAGWIVNSVGFWTIQFYHP